MQAYTFCGLSILIPIVLTAFFSMRLCYKNEAESTLKIRICTFLLGNEIYKNTSVQLILFQHWLDYIPNFGQWGSRVGNYKINWISSKDIGHGYGLDERRLESCRKENKNNKFDWTSCWRDPSALCSINFALYCKWSWRDDVCYKILSATWSFLHTLLQELFI